MRPSGRLCNALLGLDLNETGYLHSKRRDPGWPVCSFAFKSIAYSFHLRIIPLNYGMATGILRESLIRDRRRKGLSGTDLQITVILDIPGPKRQRLPRAQLAACRYKVGMSSCIDISVQQFQIDVCKSWRPGYKARSNMGCVRLLSTALVKWGTPDATVKSRLLLICATMAHLGRRPSLRCGRARKRESECCR